MIQQDLPYSTGALCELCLYSHNAETFDHSNSVSLVEQTEMVITHPPAMYLGHMGFRCRRENRICWQGLSKVFLGTSRKTLGQNVETGCDIFH